jgi:RNA polymerase sigma-70 factor (ECF subfamily)
LKILNCQSKSDSELLALLRFGNEDAFSEIYNRYWKRLLAIAYNISKDKSAAQEIVQDIFIGIWNRRLDLEIHSLNSYLASSVRLSMFKFIYRQKRRMEIESSNCLDESSSLSEELIDARFTQEYINKLVEKLPEKCKLVFRFSRNAGLSISEISMELGISEKTVEGHLTKGLKALRLSLKNSLNIF